MKTIVNIIKSFIIGIGLLMISYIFIYVIGGNEKFLLEINELLEPNIMIQQCLIAGIIGICIYIIIKLLMKIISNCVEINDKTNDKQLTKKGIKLGLSGIISAIAICATLCLTKINYSINMQSTYGMVTIVYLAINLLLYIIYNANEQNKINKAIKNNK